MSFFRINFCALLILSLLGCVTPEKIPPKTQLEIRQFQTREFAVKDSRMVMKACLNVLQDEGYIVKNANPELGLLTATKEVDIEKKGEKFWAEVIYGERAKWKKNQIIECSINVGEFADKTTVRANFQMKLMNNRGEVEKIQVNEDPSFYQEFFAKVDKGIFLGKHKL